MIFALETLLLTLVGIPVLVRASHRYGWLDIPHGRKQHKRPIPFTGGWAIFFTFWVGMASLYLFSPASFGGLLAFLPAVFAAHLLIFLGGMLDDLYDLSAPLKLIIQAASALVLIVSGLHIDTIYIPFTGSFALGWLGVPVTIFWILAFVNAMNIIDGLDGLAAGLGVITATGLIYTAEMLVIPGVGEISVILIGSLIGFLVFNFRNARIFLGDSGSQSIGFIFAVVAIYCPIKSYTVVAMLIPLLALGVPLAELTTSSIRRLVTGKSIVKGDSGHLFHLLISRGWSKVTTVVVFYAIALALQVFVFTLFLFDRRIVFSILLLFMMAVSVCFIILSRREKR